MRASSVFVLLARHPKDTSKRGCMSRAHHGTNLQPESHVKKSIAIVKSSDSVAHLRFRFEECGYGANSAGESICNDSYGNDNDDVLHESRSPRKRVWVIVVHVSCVCQWCFDIHLGRRTRLSLIRNGRRRYGRWSCH